MKMFFHPTSQQDLDTRGGFLQRTLRQHSASNRQTLFTATKDLADAATPVSVLESLSAFPRSRTAPVSCFSGLINAPEAHLGRNILICAQPLQAELASFAARLGINTAATPMWWKNVLCNYERVILLDRFHLAQSSGLAPWVRLSLSNNFPVLLGTPPGQRDIRQVLILNHDPETGGAEILAANDRLSRHCEVMVLSATGAQADLDKAAAAAIHIHYGYASHLPPSGLTPYDSLSNGVYTVVLPALLPDGQHNKIREAKDRPPKGPAGKDTAGKDIAGKDRAAPVDPDLPPLSQTRQRVDPRLIKEIKSRSYALLADSTGEMLEFVESALDRLTMFAAQNLVLNPELQRYDRMNEDYASTLLGQFSKQVPA